MVRHLMTAGKIFSCLYGRRFGMIRHRAAPMLMPPGCAKTESSSR